MKTNTPPLRTKGKYETLPPYELQPDMSYVCETTYTLKELGQKGIDVFKAYYEPVGLTVDDFKRDLSLDAAIVTLVAADNKTHYVPDTYIKSYPGLSSIAYRHNVAVIELGLLPESVDVTLLANELENTVKQYTGATVKLDVTSMAYDGEVTADMHRSMDVARKAAMRGVVTNATKMAELEQRNATLTAKLNELTAALKK